MNYVKIIKRKNLQENGLTELRQRSSGKNAAESGAQQANETVKNWIAEWREAKTIDARRAFADLFDRSVVGELFDRRAASGK